MRNNFLSSSVNYDEKDYQELLHDTIAVIESSRIHIAKQINMHVISSHWEIGKLLEERKLDSKHGDQIVKRLSGDLKGRYPNMGLSPRNLWDMKRFYLRYYQEDIKLRRSVAVLPWRHNLVLLRYDLSAEHVIFYANEILNKSWSLDMLNLALKSEYHLSIQASEKSNNFAITMSEENAEYANEIFRSRYHLGFIDAIEPLKELDLERHLVNKITSFIMELGNGFSFIGNQHTLSYNNKELTKNPIIAAPPKFSSFKYGILLKVTPPNATTFSSMTPFTLASFNISSVNADLYPTFEMLSKMGLKNK